MLLVCPNCRAEFDVPDNAIAPLGRKVQCSECSHTWFATATEKEDSQESLAHESDIVTPKQPFEMPESEENKAAANREQPETTSQPSQITPDLKVEHFDFAENPHDVPLTHSAIVVGFFKMIWISSILALCCFWALYNKETLIAYSEHLREAFQDIGIYECKGLRYDLLESTITSSGNNTAVSVKLVVKNTYTHEQTLDGIKFSFFDKDKNFLGDYTMHISKVIAALSEETVEGTLTPTPTDTIFMVISMGNLTEVDWYMVRNIATSRM